MWFHRNLSSIGMPTFFHARKKEGGERGLDLIVGGLHPHDLITYNKKCCGRNEVFHPSIHPSLPSSIHGWHHTRKKTLAEINNPPCTCVVV
jgi:hypothetical protein